MNSKKCSCGEIVKTPFCPNCGIDMEDIENTSLFPYQFKTYLHGDKLDDLKEEVMEELGLNSDNLDSSNLVQAIVGCDYEVELTHEIDADGNVTIVEVNGRKLLPLFGDFTIKTGEEILDESFENDK